ncbi:MAG: hypothetical protein ACOX8H_13565 [Ruminococcus sp.]|jgi:hypothetical protein
MSWLTDEMILYIGAIIAAVSLIGMILCFFILKINWIHLNSRLDEEYGKKQHTDNKQEKKTCRKLLHPHTR